MKNTVLTQTQTYTIVDGKIVITWSKPVMEEF